MNSETILQLQKLTTDFYEVVGDSFNQTRQSPWDGWRTLITDFGTEIIEQKDLHVLDVGCGNGRFATFMHESVTKAFKYTGIDSNQTLLQYATAALHAQHIAAKLCYTDVIAALLESRFSQSISQNDFTLVCCFGLLHHIPSQELRGQLIEELATLTKPKGFVIISLWRFAELARYSGKILDPDNFQIKQEQLEPGDYLLGWKDQPVARYCHSFSAADIESMIAAATTLQLRAQFSADGKEGSANTYLVFQKN